tara:strand:+ start:965 stop:2191 length:1227 start_codon:yes stop_codon:yes gene_type:complete
MEKSQEVEKKEDISIENTEEQNVNKFYDVVEYDSFDALGLKDTVLRGIYGYGFEQPSMIQKKAIKPIIDNKDIVAQAQSGTGKTATFSIGLLQIIETGNDNPQALILAPTRELANQIFEVISFLGEYCKYRFGRFVGGESVFENKKVLSNEKPQILVGTPGRILDLLEKKYLQPDDLKYIVIDEADEMLSVGFKEQIYNIFQKLPISMKVALFSATISPEVLDISKCFMNNPVNILVKTELLTLEGIQQYFVNVEKDQWKFDTILDLYENISIYQSIVYCNTKRSVDTLRRNLEEKNFTTGYIHGELSYKERTDIMRSFKSGETRILISTDLLARGIDIQQVSLVINYDLPNSTENYLHRIGRSGRFGRKGVAINFTTNYDIKKLKHIEEFYETQIDPLPRNFPHIIK